MDKIYVSVFVPKIDKNFNIKLPINLDINYVLSEFQKAVFEITNGKYVINEQAKLYDKATGLVINNNNIVKYSGLKNGSSVMLL